MFIYNNTYIRVYKILPVIIMDVEICLSHFRKNMSGFGNRVLRIMFGPTRDKMIGD
jgi:hypothetical protein